MPKLTINGQKVNVNDAFLKLSPDQQDDAVDEIASQIGKGNKSSLGISLPDTSSAAPQDASLQVASFDAMGTPTGGMEAAAPTSSMSYGDSMSNAGDAFINGAVRTARGVPFSDRAAAFTRSAVTGKPYAEELAALREAADKDKTANPGLAGAGQVAGAMLTAPAGALGILGKGASLFQKAAGGAASGSAFGTAQGASDAPDLTDVADTAKRSGIGALVGSIAGGALPVAGAGVGAAYRAAAPFVTRPIDGMSRVAGGLLSSAVSSRAQNTLSRLGPDALLADASPSMQGLAMGVAARPGPAADLVTDTLATRQAGQASRLAGDLNEHLGPSMSPTEVGAAMDARQAATGPMYERALGSTSAVDITPASQALENAMLSAKGRNVGRLEAAQTDLQAPYRVQGRVVPESDPRALQQAKFAMDEEIARTQGQTGSSASTATRDLTGVRDALNTSMEQQLPGFADANLAWGAAERGRGAFEAGRTALNGGKNALHPQDMAADFAARPLEQQALMRAGARSDIATTLGTSGNDLGALSRVVGDSEDFARRKMGTLFGDEARDNVVGAVNRERTFADTAGKVTAGSRTAPMTAGSRSIDDATAASEFAIPKNATMLGLLAHGGEWALRKGAGAVAGATNDATRNELSAILTAPSDVRDRIVQGLLADQLRASARGQTIAGAIGGAPTSRGLLGYVGDQRRAR